MKPMVNFLQLLKRGDEVAIINGELKIAPSSKKIVPQEWLDRHCRMLVQQICKVTNKEPYFFQSYKAGKFKSGKYSGVCLQFECLTTCTQAFVLFNADTHRARNTAKGKKGTPLPTGQFRVGKKSSFYQFWLRTGLPLPPRLSSFHDYMGNLSKLILCGKSACTANHEQLDKDSINPLNVSYDEICTALETINLTYIIPAQSNHYPDNYHTEIPYKCFDQAQSRQGFQAYRAAGQGGCGVRSKGSAGVRDMCSANFPIEIPQSQSVDDWLRDYDSIPSASLQ